MEAKLSKAGSVEVGEGIEANRLGSIPVKVGLEETTQKSGSESGGFRGVCSELVN